ncbi:class I SAM-dependent methyltransferase [Streptomyces sp. NBC_01724]|uniref:class I SAM-dependent methyltransferase n=1 Tax=unclassified Streptomyces TaxID=2593676 RepID=UPI002E36BD4B|nr:class I SAM-dependent methyltransferase [Streptomyces sp. NBC_01724]WTE49875.1 class I SAM-dependent methyltransferase [Streptomyces sp. NBC_01620]WTE57961.1 class I SAM-dependent methyltransferase [Streptomyces sp. NBC_01617]
MSPLLPRIVPSPEGKPLPQDDTAAAFRTFARDLAAGRRPWTTETAGFLSGLFDQLAGSWDSDLATGRDDPLHDALARGGSFPLGTCLELGSGTCLFTPTLEAAFGTVISIDLSELMLRHAAGRSPFRVRADASALPSADASVSVVAAIDMLLFPQELARVLAPDGVLLWINQLGQDGPLYLSSEEVAAALPGQWTSVEAAAGWGGWAALRRIR